MARLRIPEAWTAEQALLMASFLESLVQAIWNTHGHEMSELLQVAYDQGTVIHQHAPPDDDDDLEAEIPF